MRTLEDLETELKEEAAEQEAILNAVTELFTNAGFERFDRKNNYNFETSASHFKALFSIDNTTYNYTGYVTQEGSNSASYSVKGDQSGIESAAEKFLIAFEDITLNSSSEETPIDDKLETDV